MAPRTLLLLIVLLSSGCALPPPRALAPDEGWVCGACSRIARRVTLTPEEQLLGVGRERRSCNGSR